MNIYTKRNSEAVRRMNKARDNEGQRLARISIGVHLFDVNESCLSRSLFGRKLKILNNPKLGGAI